MCMPSHRVTHGTTARGFSLAEMLVVMTIAAALATVTVPRFANFMASRNVDAAARRVAADLTAARQRARTLSTSVTVSFETSKHRYLIVGMPDPDHQSSGDYVVPLSREPYRAKLLAANFNGTATCTFNCFGLPLYDGIVVVQAGGRTKHVAVSAATGDVTIGNGSGGAQAPVELETSPETTMEIQTPHTALEGQ